MARLTRIVAALGLVFAFVVLTDAPKASAASTLTLSPGSGASGTMVTATFFLDQVECFPETINFTWGGAAWTTGAMTSSCNLVVAAPVPPGSPPGDVQVRARRVLPSPATLASKLFTVLAPPATTTTTAPAFVTPTTSGGPFPTSAISATTTTVLGATTSTSLTTTTSVTDDSNPTDGEVAVGSQDSTPTDEPGSGADDSQGGGTGSGDRVRTKGVSTFVSATPGPQQSSLALAVVTTNVILTMLLLLVFGGTSAVFNSTLNSNRDVIEGWLARLRERVGAVARWLRLGSTMSPGARVLVIVVLSGAVYGFLSPGFTFDRAGLFLFLSLAVGITAVTYVSEGGALFFSHHSLKAPAAIRVHPGALFTALACVVISRSLDFQPGLMYGFVASTALLGTKLDRRQTGRAAFYPALFLLATSVIAWLILGWVRSGESGSWVSQLFEAMLAVLFVGGIEGVLYKMLPIAFLEGRAIIEWSRLAWLGLFGVSTFLFWQLLINPKDSYIDAVRETGVALVLSAALIYALVTVGAWFYFRRLAVRSETAGA